MMRPRPPSPAENADDDEVRRYLEIVDPRAAPISQPAG